MKAAWRGRLSGEKGGAQGIPPPVAVPGMAASGSPALGRGQWSQSAVAASESKSTTAKGVLRYLVGDDQAPGGALSAGNIKFASELSLHRRVPSAVES